ncbi:hypothetical protein SAMN02745784_02419 [Tissierella praeacuta DSM 18095]|uniref:N-acetyltransferase domain-containing protein n=1 Tax=Tissierella praeacuta DSM 18095 TaxID=1123404 RepID=A0A1M4XWY6_9FIRM|nr:GNAT family N-acetyltransferase [Tissierella praeacuta]SHE98104.1 hypothetical protein SAMN02745784_02419 [Tissierella praeacuta DSM 18095]SUP03433.1 Predicted acetyltransferase [Tissierella praeacuta]
MLIPFDKFSDIFDTKPFITEEVRFNLMHRIRESENPILIKSENGKIIIAQSSPQYPAWIWTSKDIEEQEYKELEDGFYNLFKKQSNLKFIAKPEIAEILADNFAKRKNITWKISMSMESYYCPSIKFPMNISGSIGKPSLDDVNIISEFFVGFIRDCFGISTTVDKQFKAASSYILSDNFYVWRNGNEIVSMANIAHRSSRHGRINEVYTSPSHRRKGYAGALVSELSKIIYKENKIPMLYTDLLNPASNKTYKKIGFVECGIVNQVSFEV